MSQVLNEQQKRWVVVRLACFESPSDVAREFKEQFGFQPTRQAIWRYDYSRKSYNWDPGELLDLFIETRNWFVEHIESIPIANKAMRLNELNKLYQVVAKDSKRPKHSLALQILEQAAKESGDAYTNRQKITHEFADLSDEELIARAKVLLGGAAQAGPEPPAE